MITRQTKEDETLSDWLYQCHPTTGWVEGHHRLACRLDPQTSRKECQQDQSQCLLPVYPCPPQFGLWRCVWEGELDPIPRLDPPTVRCLCPRWNHCPFLCPHPLMWCQSFYLPLPITQTSWSTKVKCIHNAWQRSTCKLKKQERHALPKIRKNKNFLQWKALLPHKKISYHKFVPRICKNKKTEDMKNNATHIFMHIQEFKSISNKSPFQLSSKLGKKY